MRTWILTLVLAVLVAACGTGTSTNADTDVTEPTEAPVETTTTTSSGSPTTEATVPGSSTGGTTTTTETSLPPLDGPAAPDFSLELSDGSTFLLSQESRPVYMVFWAEW